MTYSEQEVERIVVEVIRRLGILRAGSHEVESKASGSNGELVIRENVVTLRLVEGRLAGVGRLVVAPRAVVTPIVKDELKQRQIELVRESRT
jgi:hypothetical protein